MPLENPANDSPLGSDTDKLLNRLGIFWHKEMGNYVALTFGKVDKAAVEAAFASPTATSVVDPDLVKALKEMEVGDAISLPKGQVSSERSFKVRVNKAGKEAKRKLEWGEMGNNYVVRVTEIIAEATPVATNGTASAPAATPASETAKTK